MPQLVFFFARAGGVALWKAAVVIAGTLAASGTAGYFFGKRKRG